jgi:transcriptional regulator with XRE-family HTH domain
MNEGSSIGKNIREARAKNNLTQRALSEKAQMSQTQLSDYENGNKTPSLFSLAKIAKALNTTIDELFYGDASVSFITSAPDKGSIIVNSFVALWEKDVIDTYSTLNDPEIDEREVILENYSYAIRRLFENLDEFETNKNTYTNPDEYLKYVKQSVANEINSQSRPI